jgi:peptidoglycan/LPS O-acetylase OafA/YrhL
MAEIQIAEPRPAASAARPRTAGAAGKPKFAYIDCLRGYAILLVMACHTAYAVPQLPYPVHRLAVFGWHGVQLFFLASCLTLMMSAQYERDRTGKMRARDFFIRRFLRIAPMYYLAAAFYWLIDPAKDANLGQLLASLLFVNVWNPVTTTTTGAWQVVPGGWSIGVEFTFYFLFPLFVALVTNIRRALLLLAGMLLLGAALDSFLMPGMTARYGAEAADNFLYFWFFNQAPVFVLGSMIFFAVRSMDQRPAGRLAQLVNRHDGALLLFSLALVLIVAMAPLRFGHQLMFAPAVPQFLATAGAFAFFILAMSRSNSVLVNSLVAGIGKVSFSAYLLHFAVIELVLNRHRGFFHLDATSWSAIAVFAGATLVVIAVTCFFSTLTYLAVEKPMMQLAKRLTAKRAASAS